MRTILALSATLLLLLSACNTNTSPSATDSSFSEEEIAAQQQAWDDMMVVHDEVMPLMNDMIAAQRELEQLAEAAQVEGNDFHPRAIEATANLETAIDGMMSWMQHIGENKLDILRTSHDHAGILAVLDKEALAIGEVRDQMTSSLTAAKELIAERSTTID